MTLREHINLLQNINFEQGEIIRIARKTAGLDKDAPSELLQETIEQYIKENKRLKKQVKRLKKQLEFERRRD